MEEFVWDVLPRVTVGVEASDRPTCYPCPAAPCLKPAHIMLLYEHIEASERTQSPSGSLPRGADGRAPLTKTVSKKKSKKALFKPAPILGESYVRCAFARCR
jgi:hypothetical protein